MPIIAPSRLSRSRDRLMQTQKRARVRKSLEPPSAADRPEETSDLLKLALLTDDWTWAAAARRSLEMPGIELKVGELRTPAEASMLAGRDVVLLKPKSMARSCWTACSRLGGRDESLLILLHEPDQVNDYVRALDLGADECLSPDLAVDELVARMRALVRRKRAREYAGPSGPVYAFDGWTFTPGRAELTGPSGRTMYLPRNDLRLLALLLTEPGRAFSPDELSDRIEPRNRAWIDWRIRVHRLRVRLTLIEPDAGWLKTRRGEGYALVAAQCREIGRNETLPQADGQGEPERPGRLASGVGVG